uniref:Uncharacterized protein n=1 Tax=Trypanosoma congolense (strain IL3000) TaxID=1068625 RepID=G0UPQ3_TRYCI|nr:hypothetical protein, unlikely [Trypanosoma congolense IL3000]
MGPLTNEVFRRVFLPFICALSYCLPLSYLLCPMQDFFFLTIFCVVLPGFMFAYLCCRSSLPHTSVILHPWLIRLSTQKCIAVFLLLVDGIFSVFFFASHTSLPCVRNLHFVATSLLAFLRYCPSSYPSFLSHAIFARTR